MPRCNDTGLTRQGHSSHLRRWAFMTEVWETWPDILRDGSRGGWLAGTRPWDQRSSSGSATLGTGLNWKDHSLSTSRLPWAFLLGGPWKTALFSFRWGAEKAPAVGVLRRRELLGRERYIMGAPFIPGFQVRWGPLRWSLVQQERRAGDAGSTTARNGFERLGGRRLGLRCVWGTSVCPQRHPSTAQRSHCHWVLKQNGLFIKLKAAISIRKYSIPSS